MYGSPLLDGIRVQQIGVVRQVRLIGFSREISILTPSPKLSYNGLRRQVGRAAVVVQYARRWFTVEEYHRMAEAGILGEDDRVELIEGEVMQMTPIGRRHASCLARLSELFYGAMRGAAIVWPQNPVDLGEYSEPEPDLAILRRQPDFYLSGHPTPADVYLLIEICDSSVEPDRRVKVPLYARGGIAEVWLIDLEQETITVYHDPSSGGYRTARVARRGEQIAPSAFPDRPLPVSDILG
ncbi:MAG: Uma2 family endonuclease [Chloroflexi bacterium]|nr:Uma2 family endonuclease [Chloroflexota bacterium]